MNAEDVTLPELADSRIDEIEDAVFERIAHERAASERADRARRTRRRRWWVTGGAAAAIVAVAAVIAPSVSSVIVGTAGSTAEHAFVEPDAAAGDAAGSGEIAGDPTALDPGAADLKLIDPAAPGAAADREVITTASATVEVEDVRDAARAIAALAESEGGYVESMSIDETGAVSDGRYVPGDIAYPAPMGTWVTIRVPADRLNAVTEGLADFGEVSASRIDRADVTTVTIDLRARVAALEASVTRLTELMAQATSTSDLIAAESALAQRQGELESYRQQLEGLEGQVAMSSLTVSLVTPDERVEADPAGFLDGLVAGWNGFVATLNGIVIALGFLIPWLAVLGVLGLVLWAARRAARRGRARRVAGKGTDQTTDEDAV